MSNENTRFTLMAFPQGVDAAGNLELNILFIPRNISPLEKVTTTFAGPDTSAFVDAQPVLSAIIVNNPDDFPGKVPANERAEDINLTYSDVRREIYETLRDKLNENGKKKYFDIDDSRSSDKNPVAGKHQANKPLDVGASVKKYLPETYRKAFNFTSPRHRNAVTDDSYHCAVRDQKPPVPKIPDDKISWGKVYAHLLRQPLVAEKAGLLYKTSVKLSAGDFKKGGWLYVDIKAGDTLPYYPQQKDSKAGIGDFFIKRYAARIPVLKTDANGAFQTKSLFSCVLFPVLHEGGVPVGIYDDLFIESAQYQEGFAKVVHANQPVSANLLKEEKDGIHPQKEMGIRLGWDDEQILIWYIRQMAKDEMLGDRLDAPLGVTGYHVDIRKPGDAGWESLTAVQSREAMTLEDIPIGAFDGELPYQVYPVNISGIDGDSFWLPMYFSNWNDHSLVLPDKTASEIYQNDKAIVRPGGIKKEGGEVQNRNVQLSDIYLPKNNRIKLRYGQSYEFRVRLTDITGGGPTPDESPAQISPGNIAPQSFKRYVAPYALRIADDQPIKHSTDDLNFTGDKLIVQRPLLSYPAVVYTDKYDDAVALLKAKVEAGLAGGEDAEGKRKAVQVGIADPDVVKVAIKIEVETLQMDNLASDTGKENFITLYNTTRSFDKVDFEQPLQLDFIYKDFPKLDFSEGHFTPFGDPENDSAVFPDGGAIVLPTCRNIRLTLRGVCEGDDKYWGVLDEQPDADSRYGKVTVLRMRKDSADEQKLFAGLNNARLLQGIYLQPDPVLFLTRQMSADKTIPLAEGMPDIVQRLGKQLDVDVNRLTLTAKKGERLQFWCSNLIRHTLAPDNSSITFAGKTELTGHWLVATTLIVDRDWTWDGLQTRSFLINRRKSFALPVIQDGGNDVDPVKWEKLDNSFIGDLELRRIAPYQAIQEGNDGKVHREYTRIIFIDVINGQQPAGKLPDALFAQYTITPQFIDAVPEPPDAVFTTEILELPATENPHQIPKIIGAGIALSPYIPNEKYSATDARTRYLWLEFEKAPENKYDDLFARQLAYAPDQLLSNNAPEQFDIPEESPLPLDPEYIRVITPQNGHDQSGLEAMQKMEKSTDDGRFFYLLPLPQGLHNESAELFGFFTYEFRFGHSDRLWSTAQGRFGRQFRITGLQHPAPNLFCTITRDEFKVLVDAPYAQAVFNGKNVTSNPPRTSIWALLYAQVKQADGRSYRNILIDQKKMAVKTAKRLNPATGGVDVITEENTFLNPAFIKATTFNPTQEVLDLKQQYGLALALQKDAVKHGEVSWTNTEIDEWLRLYGLPVDSSLSIVCVEVFGTITRLSEHVNNIQRKKDELVNSISANLDALTGADLAQRIGKVEPAVKEDTSLPVTDELGLHRILRTSPLTEVPFICCTE